MESSQDTTDRSERTEPTDDVCVQERIQQVYHREGASSDRDRVAALSHELRLVGGIARTSEDVSEKERDKYDRLALEAVYAELARRPSRQ